MRLVHIMLGGAYAEGMRYQDNLLPAAQSREGHTVSFIASCLAYEAGQVRRVSPGETRLRDGVTLYRLPMRRVLCSERLGDKLRDARGLYELLCRLEPDWIMLHGPQTWSVFALGRYLDGHPGAHLVTDNHADAYNSAKNPLSRYILHRLLYRRCVREAARRSDHFYGVTAECMRFCTDNYGIPPEKLELLPLGEELVGEEAWRAARERRRAELGLREDELLLLHAGKLTAEKRSETLLEAMERTASGKLRLVVLGTVPDEALKRRLLSAGQRDGRIRFLGWKSGEELREYLCAADLYVQPGTQSVTMQNAACCRCALLLYPYPSHRLLLGDAALYAADAGELAERLRLIAADPALLGEYRERSFALAREKLDYAAQARRILEGYE